MKQFLNVCLLTLMVVLIGVSLRPGRVQAWGAQGHRVTAMIAENHLTSSARQKIAALLDQDQTLASVANYADTIRNFRPETGRFHYVDIPKAANNYDPARDCVTTEEGDCLIAALDRFRAQLADPNESEGRRRFALKFIVHLIGDLHQPLHCADNQDRGGNDVKVTWFGKKGKGYNLHAVWDKWILIEAGLEDDEFAVALEDGLTAQRVQELQSGTVIEWVLDAHKLAREQAYKLPSNRRLGATYYNRTAPIVDEQLLKGGLRLARILNEALP